MTTFARFSIASIAFVWVSGMGAAAIADTTAPVQQNSAVIGGDTFHTTGILRVNQAAGNGIVQANVAAIVGRGDRVRITVVQSASGTGSATGSVSVADFAFANASGLVQLNQSAGDRNAQGNAAVIRFGALPSELNDSALGAAVPLQHTSSAPGAPGGNVVSMTRNAFSRSAGIVQINQSAGTGNSTANTLLFQVQNGPSQ